MTPSTGFWASFGGRYESGTPLEVEEDELDELMDTTWRRARDFESRPGPAATDVRHSRRHAAFRSGGNELSLRAAS